MLFVNRVQLIALGRLVDKIEMDSVTIQNHPQRMNVLRCTCWDTNGKSMILDIDTEGKGTKVASPVGV